MSEQQVPTAAPQPALAAAAPAAEGQAVPAPAPAVAAAPASAEAQPAGAAVKAEAKPPMAPGVQSPPAPPAPAPAAGAAGPPAAAAKPAVPIVVQPKAEEKLPVRQYLESTVVPVLMSALQQLVKERPEDPLGYVADFLNQQNPKRQRRA